MKKLVSVTEVAGEGLDSLIGEKVLLMCMNYHYAGTLIGVNESCVLLDEKDASVVYETGPWNAKAWKDAQRVGAPLYVQRSAIEAFLRAEK